MQDFSKSGFSPADIHCVPDAGKLLLVSNLNETFESDDNGSSWKPVLTKRLDGIDLAIGLNDGSNVRLWSAGMSGIGFLDVILSPVSERKEISSVSSNPFNYGSIKIGSSKIGKIEFKNSGNVDLQLESVSIIFPEGADTTEFKIMSQPQEDLKPSEIATMNVVFRPKSLGEKGATLKIKNNAEPKELIINLQGVGTDASGVIDFKTSELIKISPNPTFDNLNVHLDMITDEISSFTIYSIVGNELFSHQVDNLIFNISLNNLPAGSYMIIFEGKKSNYISKFNKL